MGVIRSFTDELSPMKIFDVGETLVIDAKERHQLIGLEEEAIIAELWEHTDPENLSTEEDIVRVQEY